MPPYQNQFLFCAMTLTSHKLQKIEALNISDLMCFLQLLYSPSEDSRKSTAFPLSHAIAGRISKTCRRCSTSFNASILHQTSNHVSTLRWPEMQGHCSWLHCYHNAEPSTVMDTGITQTRPHDNVGRFTGEEQRTSD